MTSPTVVRIRRRFIKNELGEKVGSEIVQDCDLYIGRRMTMGGWNLSQSKWHNPYKVNKDCPLEKSLSLYEEHVRSNQDLMDSLHELTGKSLGCWCTRPTKSQSDCCCHGDVLVKLWREKYQK